MSGETGEKQEQVNNWAMLCHLIALSGLIIPTANILGPLVIWLLKKDEFPEVDQHGKESLNFQISITIYLIISSVLILLLIGLLLIPVISIAMIVFVIIASLKTKEGIPYRYPLSNKTSGSGSPRRNILLNGNI
ncbi:DUF4870 domain-containing protein [Melghirimyces algeriensis]|uniref:DUF4870 domain-containing protein n=1 Tax=Melghirimyces algeriensis TaxID=910412 RepID=A0A521AJS3_9BACL|nr:DUF4870 domain-containing protein [Melghirimyces algeriensis]SMO35018.1 hypothetical protein SAMN06264849_101181 [Melghirimyces algeriensis]